MIWINVRRIGLSCRAAPEMAIYLIKLFDHGGNTRVADWVDCADDADAIRRAKQMDVVKIGNGYDVFDGDRLVFSHRRSPWSAKPATTPKHETE